MNAFKTLSRICLLLALTLAITDPSGAEPLVSPLAVTPDTIGTELQQTFIAAPGAMNTVSNGFVGYRKKFTLATIPAKAILNVFADTRYILWINGEQIHRGPNRFETRGPQYDSLEITSALRTGTNTIAMVVMGNSSNARMMQHAPGLTLSINAAGTTLVKSDETWKCSNQTRYRPAFVTWPNIIDRIDTRLEDGDWTLPGYADTAWSAAVKVSGDSWGPLAARRIPLLRDTPVTPVYAAGTTLPVTLTTGQQLNFSMGKIVQAYTMIEIETDADTQLTFNYAGGITYSAKAGRQTYITSDSYAFSGGAITVNSGRATILSLKLIERLYPFDMEGSFSSNDSLLNRLWAVCARSGQVLSEDAYVDCADRERAEWMDSDPPGFDVTRTTFSAPGPDGKPRHADARLLGEMLRRTALSLQSGGWVKAHTCSDRFDIHAKMEDRACDWVQGARRYYESTGDQTLIREIWPSIVIQLNYFLDRRSSRGLVRAREWVVWGNPIGYFTCEGTGLNAFVYKALADAAFLGQEIGQTTQANAFNLAATNLAAAMNTVLWDETTGNYFTGYYSTADQAAPENSGKTTTLTIANEKIAPSMFSALWMLDQGVVPEARKARVTQYLVTNRAQATRIMTFYYLFFQLYRQNTAAFDTEILDILRNKWSGMANSSTLTTWEEFSGGSQAHIYGMFPGYFLSSYVLGVRVDGLPSAKKLIIEPRPGDLTFAEGKVVTEFGVVPVSWKRRHGGLEVTCTIPVGATATLRLPNFDPSLPPSVTLNGQKLTDIVTDGRYVVIPVTTAGKITASISSDLIWQGDTTNVWDTSTLNWRDVANSAQAYRSMANVIFSDIGSNAPAISLSTILSPLGVTVDATQNYSFTGSGSLGGTMTLKKTGSGTLSLGTSNSHSGGITLNGGTLATANQASLGTGPVSFGGGRLVIGADMTISNGLQVNEGGTIDIDTQGFNVTQSGDITPLDGAYGGFRKSGIGTLTLRGKSTYRGATLIDGGTLKLGPDIALPVTTGLLYRLDASTSTSLSLSDAKVAAWNSTAGIPASFTQSTPAKQPSYVSNSLNGLPVIRFSGAQQLLLTTSTAPREIIAVTTVKGGVDGNIGGLLGINNADTGLRLNSSPGSWAADGGTTQVNGTVTTSYTANQAQILHRYGTNWGNWGNTGFGQYFNNGTSRFFNGDVGEILVYGNALTSAERTSLKNYLDAKWRGINSSALGISTLPAATSVTLTANGSTWDLNGARQTIASLSGIPGTSVLLGGGSLTVGGGNTDTLFAGSISGTGNLVKIGTGIWTLSGTSSFTGPVVVSSGTLVISGSVTTGANFTVSPGATLVITNGTLSVSQLEIEVGGTLHCTGSITGRITNAGTITVNTGTMNLQGNFTNNGIVRLLNGAYLAGPGPFINTGVLDIMTGSQLLPENFVNNGTILDKSAVKVNGVQIANDAITIRIISYEGHSYQLQASDTPDSNQWENIGEPKSGTGAELGFSDPMNAAVFRKFYRIIVSP